MKKCLPLLLLFVFTAFCLPVMAQSRRAKQAATLPEPAKMPLISWESTTFDFGQLKQGEKTTTTFNFTNSGEAPLIINNVQTTCGCTATEWSRQPILPMGTGKITVTFNSAGKMGRLNKIINVFSNTEKQEDQLSLSGIVLPADKTK